MKVKDREQLTLALQAIKVIQESLMNLIESEGGCMLCTSYNKGWCTSWQAELPKEAIPIGCERWASDDIPF